MTKWEHLICLGDLHYCCYLGIISYPIVSRSNLVHSQTSEQAAYSVQIEFHQFAQSLKDNFRYIYIYIYIFHSVFFTTQLVYTYIGFECKCECIC